MRARSVWKQSRSKTIAIGWIGYENLIEINQPSLAMVSEMTRIAGESGQACFLRVFMKLLRSEVSNSEQKFIETSRASPGQDRATVPTPLEFLFPNLALFDGDGVARRFSRWGDHQVLDLSSQLFGWARDFDVGVFRGLCARRIL